MSGKTKVAFFSVVPSPYQRDIFAALARRPEIDLSIFYLEAAAPDSPWPEKPLRDFETILPGRWLALGHMRWHWNAPLPDILKYDVVVLNTLLSFTAQRLLRGALREKPWIFWGEKQRAYAGGWKKIAQALISRPLHRATAIVGVGSVAEQDYHSRFPKTPCYNIPYHCDIQPFLDIGPPQCDGEFVFLFCGQMIARKGLDLLLSAFARVAGHHAVRLLLVGREAELPKMLDLLPSSVREKIEYAGFQAPEALPEFFARAHAFVLPSRYEGWGVVVNQALAAGLPVICSDAVGAGVDYVRTEINGIRFRNEDAHELEAAMGRLAGDPAQAARWGLASREIAQDLTPEKGAERWVQVLKC